jgi:hypothetical protein
MLMYLCIANIHASTSMKIIYIYIYIDRYIEAGTTPPYLSGQTLEMPHLLRAGFCRTIPNVG